MTAMPDCRSAVDKAPNLVSSRPSRPTLDRQVLSGGAAYRRARAQEIEAEMDLACEFAATGPALSSSEGCRETWTRQAWNRYVAEAVNQARNRGAELHALLRDAAHLERLASAT